MFLYYTLQCTRFYNFRKDVSNTRAMHSYRGIALISREVRQASVNLKTEEKCLTNQKPRTPPNKLQTKHKNFVKPQKIENAKT